MKNKLIKTGMVAALLLSSVLPLTAQAQILQQTTVAQTTGVVPAVSGQRVDAGQKVLFRVVNPTGSPVNFTLSDLGVNYPVAPNSERTFFLDMANVTDRPLVAYGITGPGGQQIAGGTLINNGIPSASSTAIAAQNLMHYNTAYSAPIKPEPLYHERPVSRQLPVRGYW